MRNCLNENKKRKVNLENVALLVVFGLMVLYMIWQVSRFNPSIAIAYGVTL